MNINVFLRRQNLHLLPNSASDWKVGFQFEWDRPILRNKADVTLIYITNKVYPIIGNETIFSKAEKQQMEKAFDKLNTTTLTEANLNSIDVDKRHEFKTIFSLPFYGLDVDGDFNYDVIKKFKIEGVTYKAMTGDAYSLLQENMIALKRQNKKTYKRIDQLAYIESLWYATKFAIDVKQNYAAMLMAAWKVKDLGIKIEASAEGEGYKKLSVNLKASCPFAVKIKSLGDLAS